MLWDVDQRYYYAVIFSFQAFPLVQVAHLRSFSAIDGNIHNLSSDISFPYGCYEPKM